MNIPEDVIVEIMAKEPVDLNFLLAFMENQYTYNLLQRHLVNLEINEDAEPYLRTVEFLSQFPNLRNLTGAPVTILDDSFDEWEEIDPRIFDTINRWNSFSLESDNEGDVESILKKALLGSYLQGDRTFIIRGRTFHIVDGILEVDSRKRPDSIIISRLLELNQLRGLRIYLDWIYDWIMELGQSRPKLEYLELITTTQKTDNPIVHGIDRHPDDDIDTIAFELYLGRILEISKPTTLVFNTTYYTPETPTIVDILSTIIVRKNIPVQNFITPMLTIQADALLNARRFSQLGIMLDQESDVAWIQNAGIPIVLFVTPAMEGIRAGYLPNYEYRRILDVE